MASFEYLPRSFKGQTWRPAEEGYEVARRRWNALHSKRTPALIMRCSDVDDVVTAVRYAVDQGAPIALRGGGHGVDGSSAPDGALVIDLSALKGIRVTPDARQVWLEPGVTLGEMDAALDRHGLAVPSGQVSTTGVTGLALGGGVGYLTRRYGLTVDSIRACELVTADGRKVRASAEDNPELLWGLRGAGHNFGVVTDIQFQAHPLGSDVVTGFVVFPLDKAQEVLEQLDWHMRSAPRELCVIPLLLRLPEIPGLAEKWIGESSLLLNIVYTGEPPHAESVIGKIEAMSQPIFSSMGPATWLATNSKADTLAPWGRRAFHYCGHLPSLTKPAIEVMIEQARKQPRKLKPGIVGAIALPGMDGAVHDVDPESTSYCRAGANWMWECAADWDEPERDEECIKWVTSTRDALRPHMLASGYINLSCEQGVEWLEGVYGGKSRYQRLVALKRQWDPGNVFRFNKNIRPGSSRAE